MSTPVLEQFKQHHGTFTTMAVKVKALLEDLLKHSQIKYHFIEARAKTVESFSDKVNRPGKNYRDPIKEISDLVGARVILYYSDDVIRCGTLIQKEFQVIEIENSHQQSEFQADQFGYLSMHYIVTLAKRRGKLVEWRDYSDIQCEIQVRTVLQHSWAAISHALQYKREGDVPRDLRRKLYRLAGIFELADEEFLELRDLATQKLKETKLALAKGLDDDIKIDTASINELAASWKYVSEQLEKLSKLGINTEPEEDLGDDKFDYAGEIVEQCERLKISSIAELKKLVQYDASQYFKNIAEEGWGMGNIFVLYLLLIGARPKEFTADSLATDGWHKDIAARVINGAQKAK